MKVYSDIKQITPEWFALKSGIPSATGAKKILTATGNLSTQAGGYIDQLLAERAGFGEEMFEPTEHMLTGIEREPEARDLFTFETGLEVHGVAWVTNDAGTAGCSPDGLIDNKGVKSGWEVKCPMAKTQFGYLRKGVLPSTYKQQIHWSMAVTGLTRWYFMSYFPGLDPLIIQIKADSYTDKVTVAMNEFTERLAIESERFGLERVA